MDYNYVIYSDSGCDIAPKVLEEWGVKTAALLFRFDGDTVEYDNGEMPLPEFYIRMRAGDKATTSAVNAERFKELFRPALESGQDVLSLNFSSGLSATCQSAMMAADELREEFPDRRIVVVDSLSASSGQGLLLWLVVQKRAEGASLDEVKDFLENNRLKLCHWFTVDDLVYLKRGGRINPAVALVGTMLGIKPVLHVDDEGHLISRGKVRGRKASLEALANKYAELAEEPGKGPIFICHADCLQDARMLEDLVQDKTGGKVDMICDVGPVIGAHSGPGTVAIFFLGKQR